MFALYMPSFRSITTHYCRSPNMLLLLISDCKDTTFLFFRKIYLQGDTFCTIFATDSIHIFAYNSLTLTQKSPESRLRRVGEGFP